MPEGHSLRSLARSIPAVVRRDYLASTVAHWFTLASGLLLFHLVAQRASTSGFAYYQVARGLVATLQPVALIGLVPALHRFLPRAGPRIRVLARQAFVVQLVILNVLGLTALLLADDLGRLLGLGGAPQARAVIVLTAGNCLCVVAAAALRGCGQVWQANLVYLLGLGLLPLAAFAVTERIDVFLIVQGAAMAAVACWGIAVAGPRRAEHRPPRPTPAPSLRTLLRYGIRRAPGDMALPALFSFPTFYVAGAAPGSAEAGYLGFATSAVTLICSLFGMLTPVLLPRLSGAFHGLVPSTALTRGLKLLPPAAAILAIVATASLALVADPVVHYFLGDEFDGAAAILRWGMLTSVPFAAFYAARPTLDALQDAPVITRLLLGSLIVEVVITYAADRWLDPAYAALFGLGAGALVLGLLSYVALLLVVPAIRGNAE
ncbi:MAG: hypothetical protein ABW046_02080 [Actinoplanes sp.]